MTLEDNQIVVTSNLVFSDQPPAGQEGQGEAAPKEGQHE
jgi:hypothetical protein